MSTVSISSFWFSIITTLFIWWFLLISRYKDLRGVYFFYFLLNFLMFLGPLLYYKVGFTGYATATTEYSLNIFYYINVTVAIINIFAYLYYKKTKGVLFYNSLKSIRYSEIINKQSVTSFYWITIIISIIYISIFRESFPLVQLFAVGELGERLDHAGTVPFFILFSSFFLVFVPSAFLYLRLRHPKWYITIPLFVFTLFCLTVGGNKGLVSFFLLFYVLVCTKEEKTKRIIGNIFKLMAKRVVVGVALILTLATIYAILKGKTELNNETLTYLIESPLRRLLAGQGLGYIARIELINRDAFDSIHMVKHIVFSYIYGTPIGSGSAPTHFTGSMLIDFGYFITFAVFLAYTLFVTKILNTTSLLYKQKEDSFIIWGFFVPIFIMTFGDLSIAHGIRTGFVVLNIVIVRFASRLKLP